MGNLEAISAYFARRKRNLHVYLVDRGYPPRKKLGLDGILQLGHRGYVGRDWKKMGLLQYQFMLSKGLKPSDVLYDIGCGSLRGGRHFIKYLNKGHYLGLEAEKRLVELGLDHEVGKEIVDNKLPEFVISSEFEFHRFSRSPNFAMAISLFSHLTETDICSCLTKLASVVSGSCIFFATFNEVSKPAKNYKRSHAHLAFCYTRDQMEKFGRDAGWGPTYIEERGVPVRQQRMMQYLIEPG
jgi:hypothetical protein